MNRSLGEACSEEPPPPTGFLPYLLPVFLPPRTDGRECRRRGSWKSPLSSRKGASVEEEGVQGMPWLSQDFSLVSTGKPVQIQN